MRSNTASAARMSHGAGDRQIMHLMKSHGESTKDVLPPSVLGAGITMIKKLLTAKFAKGLRRGGEGLFGGEVDTSNLLVY
jgi:hypothetical protein